jgi:hypothetical protein
VLFFFDDDLENKPKKRLLPDFAGSFAATSATSPFSARLVVSVGLDCLTGDFLST